MAGDDQETDDEVAPKSEGGIISMILPPVLAGAAGFAATFLLPGLLSAEDTAADAPASEIAAAEDGTGERAIEPKADRKSKKKKGKDKGAVELAIVSLEPFIVSLPEMASPGGRPYRLRVVLAVEGEGAALKENETARLTLRDQFTATIRTMPTATLGQAEGLETLRTALFDSAQTALGEGIVTRVLITDFLIT